MTPADPPPARRPRRLGLYIPFILLGLALLGWTVFWFIARGQAETRMDRSVEALRAAGYDVAWRTRRIDGFPYRLNVNLEEARIREPSGWGLEAPKLEAQAFMHALGHWVLAAPEGAVFVRPQAGGVSVKGEVLRASLAQGDGPLPRVSLEGRKLTFTPAAGAQPFALTAADRLELHLRPAPKDQAQLFLKVDAGQARLAGLLGRIAGEQPISVALNATLSQAGAFKGDSWPGAVRSWADAGGQLTVREAGLTAGEAVVGADAGTLSAGSDGRLRGSLQVSLRQAPRALSAMGQTGVILPEAAQAAAAVAQARQGTGEVARATLNFEAGRTTLGPVALGPAPRVYAP